MLDEVEVARVVQQGVAENRLAFQKVRELVPGVICTQIKFGDSMKVTIAAGRDYYDPGKFKLEDAPSVAELAHYLAKVHSSFRNLQGTNFEVHFKATGTADAIPIEGGIDYDGLAETCLVKGRYRTVNPGPKALDNELLACARAIALAQELLHEAQVKPLKILSLEGQELGAEGGMFRSVNLELTFINLRLYAPDADFCG